MKNLLILVIILTFLSCSKTTPSGFWLNYETDSITEKQNDQGPFGGTLIINWINDKGAGFNIKTITELATRNDWKLIDSTAYKKSKLTDMTEFGNSIINLPLKNFKSELKDSNTKPLPRWINKDFTLYRFKTKWHIFESGTDNSTSENGFILLSFDNKAMTVYHLWGE
ncbi:hypothetical protein [Psychroserpens sp.]|uniref:hypothetical protein n=1 Tax=Psychroserpens sp. TaxID=2020870 RepID=UPI001B2ACCBF|nr:hypothetical protein [Psychroserpens sp.]MBO6606664.1 hypothetical protein [Psychroserpens sp.]MBO6631994.1 hypothetical protein [Psychroserpens sp.]MBO6653368.1 hypothetical protein [Psychroserpens sp.]MBO6680605.1 hypothetical protein [Psychroserpens sp.]MBO6750437.1 hypothetical protein [Psychroserpens sp.]